MGRKTFVIDTNVLLHDPDAIRQFKNNDVVIPLPVLEELDSMKHHSNDRGKNAREAIRYVDSLRISEIQDLHLGVEIPGGSKLRISFPPRQEKLTDFPLNGHHKTLSVAHLLKNNGEKVVFVSRDFVSRLKAESIGLSAEDYRGFKVFYDEMYKGIRQMDVEKKYIDLFYKDGFIEPEDHSLRPNEFCLLKSMENSSAVCKYNHGSKRLESLLQLQKDVWGIAPLNVEQRCAIDLLLRDDINLVTLLGPAGTGKTLLALACGMHKVFDDPTYSRILVSRPIVPLGKDIGFLPGTKEEKLYHWMQPIYDNLEYLCQKINGENGSATYDWVMESKKIEMEAVTYIRGRTLPKMFMIIDEAQNLTPHEVKTIISRAGKGSKVILTGDPTQIDNPYLDKDNNGLSYAVSKFKDQKIHGHISLDKTERSELAAIAAEIM